MLGEGGSSNITTGDQELEVDFTDDDGELDEMLATEAKSSQKVSLSNDQKARSEKNKLKALALRKARLQAAPYSKGSPHSKRNCFLEISKSLEYKNSNLSITIFLS